MQSRFLNGCWHRRSMFEGVERGKCVFGDVGPPENDRRHIEGSAMVSTRGAASEKSFGVPAFRSASELKQLDTIEHITFGQIRSLCRPWSGTAWRACWGLDDGLRVCLWTGEGSLIGHDITIAYIFRIDGN